MKLKTILLVFFLCLVLSFLGYSQSGRFNSFITEWSSVTLQERLSELESVAVRKSKVKDGLYIERTNVISNVQLANPDGIKVEFHLPYPVNNSESVKVKIGKKNATYGIDYTIDPIRQIVVFAKPPNRKQKIMVSYETVYNEFSFSLNFDGLYFNSDHKQLQGFDSEAAVSNATYLAEKKYINFTCSYGEAWPELVPSQDNPSNKVLYFRVDNANEHNSKHHKVRISCNVRKVPATSFTNTVDVLIPIEWAVLQDYENGIDWLTQQEYWCSSAGTPREGYPQFRMTVGMLKNRGKGKKLYYYLKCQDLFTTVNHDGSLDEKYVTLYEVDHRKDEFFPIPLGEWFNVRTEVISGDKETGHFKMTVTTANGKQYVIFDEICPTHATGYDEPDANEALYTSLSPLKLYTSSKILEFFQQNNKSFGVYYDNWSFIGRCVNHE